MSKRTSRAAPEILTTGIPAILILVMGGAVWKIFFLKGNTMAVIAGTQNMAVQAMVLLIYVVATVPNAHTPTKITDRIKVTIIAFSGVFVLD